MKTINYPRLLGGMLTVAVLSLSTAVHAVETQHLIISPGDSAQSREAARQSQEQWDATHGLRKKMNNRQEKDFDKYDQTLDLQEKCNSSQNVNAYWEANTSRCLDRRTGRALLAP